MHYIILEHPDFGSCITHMVLWVALCFVSVMLYPLLLSAIAKMCYYYILLSCLHIWIYLLFSSLHLHVPFMQLWVSEWHFVFISAYVPTLECMSSYASSYINYPYLFWKCYIFPRYLNVFLSFLSLWITVPVIIPYKWPVLCMGLEYLELLLLLL
jgi:hypothetical protein